MSGAGRDRGVSKVESWPAGPPTSPQHALEELRRAIVAGELRPGQKVAQEEIAERLGMSISPVREALRVLEQEGQLAYYPRRGYFVTELRIEDLEEIYALRKLIEGRAARLALPDLADGDVERIELAAHDCVEAAHHCDVAAELEANRRFHFAILQAPDQQHTMRLIRLLWDSTESYRALYYNSRLERKRSLAAHERILAALHDRDPDRLVAELDEHRGRALSVLRKVLGQ